MGGPLSAKGPLGTTGPLSDYWYNRVCPCISSYAHQLMNGGVFSILGPVGPLGALGKKIAEKKETIYVLSQVLLALLDPSALMDFPRMPMVIGRRPTEKSSVQLLFHSTTLFRANSIYTKPMNKSTQSQRRTMIVVSM